MATVYCTSFCNHGHIVEDGRPVEHECYVLDSRQLQRERDGLEVDGDIVKTPRRIHRGVSRQKTEG